MGAYSQNCVQKKHPLLRPLLQIAVIGDIASTVIMKLLINIHQRRGNLYIRFHREAQAMGLAEQVQLDELLPPAWLGALSLHEDVAIDWALATLCRAVYDPRRDDAYFRRSLVGDAAQRKAAFDQLRKHYPHRREIDGLQVRLDGDAPHLAALVGALGCRVL